MNGATTPGTALVTGASSGIGAIYADRLAARGHDLILVARREGPLEEQARRLGDRYGRSVRVLAADLSDQAELARVETVLRTDPSVTMLINNAGFGATAPLLEADVDTMQAMIFINVTALTRLAYAAAPAFVARGGGTIVNIASAVAIAPEILNGVYGATKAYVLAFSRSLRKELSAGGVRVQVVLPGATATAFWGVAGKPSADLPAGMMAADDMVDASLSGLVAGEFVTIPSLPDAADWTTYEAARQALMPNLSKVHPAARYAAESAGH